MSCKTEKTLTFDEKVKGWTSFHSFLPDWMLGMNNKFFSFKGGELYQHHSDNVARNNFYEEQFTSKVGVMVNDSPSDIKALQAISLEGSDSWDALIKAYVSSTDDYMESSISTTEFVKKEGIWYAYARRNESDTAFDSKATYGIGVCSNFSTIFPSFYDMPINGWSTSLCIGDTLLRGSDLTVLGTIATLNKEAGTILVEGSSPPNIGDFIVGMKDARIEGGNLRGYTMRVDLENSSTLSVELFSVNAEVMKSYS